MAVHTCSIHIFREFLSVGGHFGGRTADSRFEKVCNCIYIERPPRIGFGTLKKSRNIPFSCHRTFFQAIERQVCGRTACRTHPRSFCQFANIKLWHIASWERLLFSTEGVVRPKQDRRASGICVRYQASMAQHQVSAEHERNAQQHAAESYGSCLSSQ